MFRRPANDNEQKRDDYLRYIDDAYVFNSISGLYEPKTYAEEKQSTRKKPGSDRRFRFFTDPKRDWITIGVGIATLAVVGLYTHYARLQWQEAQKTAIQATRAADAAASAANTADATLKSSQKSFEIDQRPYLVSDIPAFVQPFAANSEIRANVTIKNLGRTVAIKQVTNIDFVRFDIGKRAQFISFIKSEFRKLESDNAQARKEIEHDSIAEMDIAPLGSYFSSNQNLIKLSDADWRRLQGNGTKVSDVTLFYVGVASVVLPAKTGHLS